MERCFRSLDLPTTILSDSTYFLSFMVANLLKLSIDLFDIFPGVRPVVSRFFHGRLALYLHNGRLKTNVPNIIRSSSVFPVCYLILVFRSTWLKLYMVYVESVKSNNKVFGMNSEIYIFTN